jgi:transposase-like protein
MASKRNQNARRRSEEMFVLMKAFEKSGQTQRSFREAHGVGRSTFQYWLRRYRQSKQEQPPVQNGFVPLEVRPAGVATLAAGIVITYSDGTRVELPTPAEASFIRRLIGR